MTNSNEAAPHAGKIVLSLESAFREHVRTNSVDMLREAICVYVDAMRAEGQAVERVIIDVKRIARQAFIEPSYSYWNSPLLGREDVIIERAVTWCIRHYYSASTESVPARAPTTLVRSHGHDNDVSDDRDHRHRLARAVELLARYERAKAAHTLSLTRYKTVTSGTEALRIETEFMTPIRRRMEKEREKFRNAVRAEVGYLKGRAVPPLEIILVVNNTVIDALQQAQMTESVESFQRDALDFTLEALFAA